MEKAVFSSRGEIRRHASFFGVHLFEDTLLVITYVVFKTSKLFKLGHSSKGDEHDSEIALFLGIKVKTLEVFLLTLTLSPLRI